MTTQIEIVEPAAVAQAAERLAGIINRTPVMTSRTLNEHTGRELYLKCENFQRGGSFKIRGAYNAVSQLSDEQKAAGVVAFSSGNHAQGVALAGRLLGVPVTIVMPYEVTQVKREATAGYGADIILCDLMEREAVVEQLVAERGYTRIDPYDNPRVLAGQGTAAWELFDEVGELDLLFVPVGGGGLLSGSALAAVTKSPDCKVIGVEPETAADVKRSWQEGAVYTLPEVPQTIADGLRTRFVGEHNLPLILQYVHDMLTVSEAEIIDTLQFVWQRMKIIIEPSSAVALAPLYSGKYEGTGRRVGVIISGGNVEIPAVAEKMKG